MYWRGCEVILLKCELYYPKNAISWIRFLLNENLLQQRIHFGIKFEIGKPVDFSALILTPRPNITESLHSNEMKHSSSFLWWILLHIFFRYHIWVWMKISMQWSTIFFSLFSYYWFLVFLWINIVGARKANENQIFKRLKRIEKPMPFNKFRKSAKDYTPSIIIPLAKLAKRYFNVSGTLCECKTN